MTDAEKASILAYHDTGMSHREIAAKIGRSKCAVQNVCSPSSACYKKKRTGRPKKVSPRDARRIVNHFSNTCASLRAAPAVLNIPVLHETIRKVLKDSGNIMLSKKLKAPALTATHKQKRIDFCRANVTRNWKEVSVLFYSLTYFRLFFPMKKNGILMVPTAILHTGTTSEKIL